MIMMAVVMALVLVKVVMLLPPLILLSEVCEETVFLPVISNMIPIS